MDQRTPAQVLSEHRIGERQAWSIPAVFCTETWPRIARAMRLHRLDKLGTIHSHVRCIPWPHVAAYNALLERIVTARTTAELRLPILAAKEQVIRRIIHNTYPFSLCGDWENRDAYASFNLSAAERDWARRIIVSILRVGPEGDPADESAVPWFAAWRWAVWTTERQSHRPAPQSPSAPHRP